MPAEKPARDMSDAELLAELSLARHRFEHYRDDDDEGHSGSPGEWLYERIDELKTENERRINQQNLREIVRSFSP
jgi:hypothetical protein